MKLDSAVFYTNDLGKVVEFYSQKLGLEIDFIQEGKFASFKFENGVKLGIKQKTDERELPGSQTIFISVSNIKELYEKFKNEDYNFYKHLEELSWGTHFSILDPDGNKVEFMKRNN